MNDTPESKSPTAPAVSYPYDEAGLRESVDRATVRLWQAEERRREQSTRPLHLFGIVTVALMHDEDSRPVVGLGLDYIGAPGGNPIPMLRVVGEHLVRITEEALRAAEAAGRTERPA